MNKLFVFVFAAIISAASTTAVAQKLPSTDGDVQATYDKFTDLTTYDLVMTVAETKTEHLVFSVNQQSKGPNPPSGPPLNVLWLAQTLGLFGYREWRDGVMYVIADEKRYQLTPNIRPNLGKQGALYIATIGGTVAFDDFVKIAHSKKVEMRFEGIEFSLTSAQLASMNKFLRYYGYDE